MDLAPGSLSHDPPGGGSEERTQRERLLALAREASPLAGVPGVVAAVERIHAHLSGLGPLEPLLADPHVSEVMVNEGGATVWVERAGRLERCPLVLDESAVLGLVERIVAPLGLHVDRASPLVDARMPDGSRVHVVVRPLAVDGTCMTIRRFGVRSVDLDEVCSPEVAELLEGAVTARLNVVVSGGAGAGKTTLLNTLAGRVPHDERVVTVEDTAELDVRHPHVVRLEARPANTEGVGAIGVRDLVRTALRMRPDRIVVGEVRGPEALDMLQAMNTGHAGSLSTCHANGPDDALRRLETLVLMGSVSIPLPAVREQISSALDLVVHLARSAEGRRRVVAVHEVGRCHGSAAEGLGSLWTRPIAVHDRVVADPERSPRVP